MESKTAVVQIERSVKIEAGKALTSLTEARTEKPLEFVVARKEYMKSRRNDLRESNAVHFLTTQEGFLYAIYSKIGNREGATFYIGADADFKNCVATAKISKVSLKAGFEKLFNGLAQAEKAGVKVVEVSTTKNGNIALKLIGGVITTD